MGLAIIETGNTEENPYDLSWYGFACKDLYDDYDDDTDMYEVCMAVIQDYPALYEKICRMVKPLKLSLYAYWNLVHIWESPDFNTNESYRQKRYTSLFEAKALTPEEKMDRWHNGTRKENIKACNIDKLKEYRKICRAKGYTEQVKLINAELKRRKDEGINESLTADKMPTIRKAPRRILEGKNDSGLRNDVLYSFLTKRVTPIVVSALAAKGIKAEPHKFTEKETIHRALIDIKSKGGINGMKQFALNYYDGGDVIAISNDKFMNGVKASKGFLFVSPVDNCIYGIPSTVMQSSWRGIMIDRRDPRIEHSNVAIVMDALGMRNQISLCDPDLVRQLAVENGFVITMGQSDADKFKKELDEYKALV